jgi:hypothetical protein
LPINGVKGQKKTGITIEDTAAVTRISDFAASYSIIPFTLGRKDIPESNQPDTEHFNITKVINKTTTREDDYLPCCHKYLANNRI